MVPEGYIIDWSAWISGCALLVAGVSALFAYLAFKQSKQSIQREWIREVITWSNRTINILVKMHLCVSYNKHLSIELKLAELVELSTCIEQGRLLFENDDKDVWGTEKEYAYRGFRPSFMDELVAVFNAYHDFGNENTHTKESFSKYIEKCQRRFVSDIQEIIQPKWFFQKAIKFNKEVSNAKNK